jgi:hypothetical protein
VTVLGLVRLRRPAEFADWYRFGTEYVRDVSVGMGFEGSEAVAGHVEDGVAAMRDARTDPPEPVARAVAADLLADAAFAAPFCEWMPTWYELALAGGNALAARQLRRVGRAYAAGLDAASEPRFSRPRDVLVRGRPATAGVSGFAERFVLADAVLHLEWYVHVAGECGVRVPPDLVARTRRESVAYYTGRRASLSPRVREFQRLLFTDDEWVRRVDDAYDLDSALLSVWARLLARAREDLERAADGSEGDGGSEDDDGRTSEDGGFEG